MLSTAIAGNMLSKQLSITFRRKIARSPYKIGEGRTRRFKFFSFFFILALVFLSQLGTPLAQAAPRLDAFSPLPHSGEGNPPLTFQNGWVQNDPKVSLVFWGPEWNTDQTHIAIKNQIITTFSVLAGSQYNNILTQYHNPTDTTNANNFVHNDVTLGAYATDTASPPAVPVDIGVEFPGGLVGGEIRGEAIHALKDIFHVQPDPNTQVLVFPQQGTTYALPDACGMHSYDSTDFSQKFTYAYVRYSDAGSQCNAVPDDNGNRTTATAVARSTAWYAVHEYSEAATDPHIYLTTSSSPIHGSGWNTNEASLSGPHEVADLCGNYIPDNGDIWDNGKGDYYRNSSGYPMPWPTYYPANTGISLMLPFLWSNNSNGCVMSEGLEYPSPVSPGRHTVQGLILSHYQYLGGLNGTPGAPISEEGPIAGGAVSYFQGPCGSTGSCAAIYYGPGAGAWGIWGNDYQKYLSEGGPGGNFGFPTTDPTYMNGGAVSYFQGSIFCGGSASNCAAIFDKSGVGTFADWGNDLKKYLSMGGTGGNFGFPVSDPTVSGGGAYSLFQGGIYCGVLGNVSGGCAAVFDKSGVGTFADWGNDLKKYMIVGGPASSLSFPTSDPISTNGGAVSYFAGHVCSAGTGPHSSGSAIYDSSAGTYIVQGCIYYDYWHSMQGPAGLLGFPVSDEQTVYSGTTSAAVSYFAGQKCDVGGPNNSGSALYSWSVGTYEIHGCIYARYIAVGGPSSKLGFPISNEYTNAAGYPQSDFNGGSIVFQNGSAIITYNCVGTGTCN